MPELPEAEVIRRDLDTAISGKHIARVDVTRARSVRRYESASPFVAALEGRKVVAVRRRGKYLVVALDDGRALVVHLGMSGQLLWVDHSAVERKKHTHVVLAFEEGGELRFVDPRTFGQMFVTSYDALAASVPELAHFGPDPFDDIDLASLLRARTTKLKPLLMDQRFLAGIGNIYSDEILFRAGLRWDRAANTLSPVESARLQQAITDVLTEGIANRGSSLADAQYVDLYGRAGAHQHAHRVYDREGKPCTACGTPIERARFTNRSTFFCPTCQA